ncbi:MAG: cysteine--tRNA ligase [Coriobacteriales bacterium]|jgi:cysteinyl-tRNA synthetase|nr:cysteine--tRNA ligase [Coriobacteriales bacterium]
MRVYNTLTRKKEEFVPIVPGKVGFYICGPTVYNDIHIGNARTFLSFDVIRRYLEFLGYEVNYVQNLTDVDDKIIKRAAQEGISASELAKKYASAFTEVMTAVGVKKPSIQPRATEEIEQMIAMISELESKGHAYAVDGDVYFAVRSFSAYGELSGRDIEQLQSGARVDIDERKRDPLDFALWKAAKPGEPAWDSPWGQGRPGWHIECSAMSARYLGTPFDIHAGGDDLVFPHHENERAQSEACAQTKFANYWLHGGMLTIDSEKMSKSEGNFLLLKDVLTHVRPQALRLLMLQTHYRSTFDYSPERLNEAMASLERIETALRNLKWLLDNTAEVPTVPNDITDTNVSWTSDLLTQIERCREQFVKSMDDDFNTASAMAAIFDLVTAVNSSTKDGIRGDTHRMAVDDAAATIVELLAVLGVDLLATQDAYDFSPKITSELVKLAEELTGSLVNNDEAFAITAVLDTRARARAAKDWALADAIRDRLAELGLIIEDTAQGARVVRK